ncbi:MAG TPA: hypothetical protein VH256_08775 [Thermoleophilaceae bacterium]|nr:hypothetical protein [Thermoleophilaceae bacterium]
MSAEDVEVVRRLLDFGAEPTAALLDSGMSSGHALLSMWHPDCVLKEMAEVPDVDVYRGRDGVARYFGQLDEMLAAVGL